MFPPCNVVLEYINRMSRRIKVFIAAHIKIFISYVIFNLIYFMAKNDNDAKERNISINLDLDSRMVYEIVFFRFYLIIQKF